jgi:hydroxypyruvate reductase
VHEGKILRMDAERFKTHSLTDQRVARILAAAIDAVEPGRLVWDHLQRIILPKHQRVYLLGIGKAAEAMTRAASEFFVDFSAGLVITKHTLGLCSGQPSIVVMEGGHPMPDERSLQAGQAALDFIWQLNEDDLLICLISGGGSALVTAPKDGITLEDICAQTAKLLANGATIHEINKMRRQMDRIKGGGLTRATKAQVVSLILSDVLGNSLETIASGLTVDPSLGARVQNFIVGDIRTAAQAAQQTAASEGFDSLIFDLQIQGEAREVGLGLAKRFKEERKKSNKPFCLIAGGETTVTLQGNGKGGRNQELALAAVDELRGLENILLVSLATDGDDGPTDAAGAVVNGATHQRAESIGISVADYLARNDAYNFFRPLNDLIQCGYTGTNVNDLIFLVGF